MNPDEPVKVKIDLGKVAANLRTADGASVGEGTVRSFLIHAGFNPTADGAWVGRRGGLHRLNHSEVVGIEPLGYA